MNDKNKPVASKLQPHKLTLLTGNETIVTDEDLIEDEGGIGVSEVMQNRLREIDEIPKATKHGSLEFAKSLSTLVIEGAIVTYTKDT